MSDITLTAVLENAERLLRDADILAAAGSYRTAVSLAVLSLEESGKACLIRWKTDGHLKRDISREICGGHIDKHQIFGAYKMVKAILTVGKIVKRPEGEAPYDDPEFTKVIAEALIRFWHNAKSW
jgi:AbiV family abortive infection protein